MTRPLETRATLHVVVGIVGAGKTTFLQHLLDAPDPAARGRPPAVVVGEHADEGFDDVPLSATGALVEQLVRTSDDPTGGYSEPIRRILLRSQHGRIYLETSGVTRIGHVVRALPADGDILHLREDARALATLGDPVATLLLAGHPGLIDRVEVAGQAVVIDGRHVG